MEACTFPGCVFQILSVVSPVEGQERRICHYQLGSAKQLVWRGAVKSQEVGNLTQGFRDAGKVRGGGGVGGGNPTRPQTCGGGHGWWEGWGRDAIL